MRIKLFTAVVITSLLTPNLAANPEKRQIPPPLETTPTPSGSWLSSLYQKGMGLAECGLDITKNLAEKGWNTAWKIADTLNPLNYIGQKDGGGPNPAVALDTLIPDLLHAIRADFLVDLATALRIINRTYNQSLVLADCDSPIRPHVNVVGNGLSAESTRWYKHTDGTWFVPIVMDTAFTASERETIFAGMIDIQQKTCMRFYIYGREADLSGFDFVKIVRGSRQGCYSDSIGRAGKGRQIVNLQPMEPSGCIVAGIAAHELLHAIGFDHQQCTPGRDNYVTIVWRNIQTNAQHNFEENSANKFTNFEAPYDYGSVMHYSEFAFSTNRQKTIVPKQSGVEIGQRKEISKWDAYKLNKMHQCPAD